MTTEASTETLIEIENLEVRKGQSLCVRETDVQH